MRSQKKEGITFRVRLKPYKKECQPKYYVVEVKADVPFDLLDQYIREKASSHMNLKENLYEIRVPKEQNLVINQDNYEKFRDAYLKRDKIIDLLVREFDPQERLQKYGNFQQEQGCISQSAKLQNGMQDNQVIWIANESRRIEKSNDCALKQELKQTQESEIFSFDFISSDRFRPTFFSSSNSFDNIFLLRQLDLVYESELPYPQ